MSDLGVKLDACEKHSKQVVSESTRSLRVQTKDLVLGVGDARKWRIRGIGNCDKALGQLAELVMVAHPHLGITC